MSKDAFDLAGGCACRALRYRLTSAPMFVHCCHCHWCQRESGSAFALNALIESARIDHLAGEVDKVLTPTASKRGQHIARCPRCRVAVWSHYASAGEAIAFVRVGTLEDPREIAPHIHIYTTSKQPWVVLAPDIPAMPEYYQRSEHWPAASLARRAAALAAFAGA